MESLPLQRDHVVSGKLSTDLTARGIRSIEFAAGFRLEEYEALVRSLLLKPERLADRGGLESVLLDEGVSSITINRMREGQLPDAMDLLTELSLMGLLSQERAGGGAAARGAGASESMNTLMSSRTASVAEALCEGAARKDRTPSPGNPDFRADQVALGLERMAQRAFDENKRPRGEILADIGRIVAATPPQVQIRLMAPRSGNRQARGALSAAVEQMAPETIAEIVSQQQSAPEIEYGRLHDALSQTSHWRSRRQATFEAIERRLASRGIPPVESKEILDHLVWPELDLERRLYLLSQRDHLWRVDFQRVKEVLVKLFGENRVADATALIQRYLSGLLVEDPLQRRRVAENARYILQLVEKTGKGLPMLRRMGELFLARLQDESDEDVQSRLASALAFLADLRLREGERSEVLALMCRADEMAASPAEGVRERGERLKEALSRVGSEKLFEELADRHLGGDDAVALEAAAILRHAGLRAVNYLIDRLAVEEDRGHRADLVRLLKEMDRSATRAFTDRLRDPRWFLVRNVLHILGELGDPAVLPALKEIAAHEDPRVRKELVKTAMRLGGPDGERLVMDATSDQDRTVQLAAMKSLSGLRGGASADLAIDLATRVSTLGGSDAEMRREAVMALGRRRVAGAVGPLVGILRRKALIGYAEPTELRVAAAQALGMIGGGQALEALAAAAREDSRKEVREAAEQSQRMEKVGTPADGDGDGDGNEGIS
jgi:HEAT repeat protein